MTDEDAFRRYVEAGMALFAMTQQRAEAALKDLAGSGEAVRGQAQRAVEWLVECSRGGTEELLALVRAEIRQQVAALGLATKDDIARLEARLAGAGAPAPAPKAPKAAPRKATARKPAARRATAAPRATARPGGTGSPGTPSVDEA